MAHLGKLSSQQKIKLQNQEFGFDYDYENMPKQSRAGVHKSHQNNRKLTTLRVDPKLPNNKIQTSKYTIINFIPKNLGEQFSKGPNIYFLCFGLLQLEEHVTITKQVPTILFPLIFIVILTAIKDFYEDYKRKKSDNQENKTYAHYYNSKQERFEDIQQYKLRCGDIVQVHDQETLGCDVLILASSEKKGLAYIETKNLDGETNLKQKKVEINMYKKFLHGPQVSKQLKESEDSNQDIINWKDLDLVLEYEKPNTLIYQFSGSVHGKPETYINRNEIGNNKISVNADNFVLRGSRLKNTKSIIGMVIYTGHDTRLMMNSFKARAKKSKVEKLISKTVLFIFGMQCAMCLLCSLYYSIWYTQNKDDLVYLEIDQDQIEDNAFFYNLPVIFGTWMLIFGNFVPISLLITLEMVKLFQGIAIKEDPKMDYHFINEGQDEITETVVQSSNLNEELGQIQYIFSDKTGTLTCNKMEFKKISINGISYGDIDQDSEYYMTPEQLAQQEKVTNVDFRDQRIIEIINDDRHPEYDNVMRAVEVLAFCHTVVIDRLINQDGQEDVKYNASSPDELALLNFARFLGFKYWELDDDNNMIIKFGNKTIRKKLLYVLEFNSDRKRMSVIVENEEGYIEIMCKGADSIILERLNRQKSKNLKQTTNNLDEYGRIGLRTLLLSYRKLPDNFWEQ